MKLRNVSDSHYSKGPLLIGQPLHALQSEGDGLDKDYRIDLFEFRDTIRISETEVEDTRSYTISISTNDDDVISIEGVPIRLYHGCRAEFFNTSIALNLYTIINIKSSYQGLTNRTLSLVTLWKPSPSQLVSRKRAHSFQRHGELLRNRMQILCKAAVRYEKSAIENVAMMD
jgi:hypothetical protein